MQLHCQISGASTFKPASALHAHGLRRSAVRGVLSAAFAVEPGQRRGCQPNPTETRRGVPSPRFTVDHSVMRWLTQVESRVL
jgi:hypothetical protein